MMKKTLAILIFTLTLILAACSSNNPDNTSEDNGGNSTEHHQSGQSAGEQEDHTGMDHSEMDHSGSGEIPQSMKEAENPKYKVGSKVIIEEGHMPGMQGAEATVAAVYDTTVYTVSYDPVTGGDRIENHKWVVHEELQDSGEEPFEPGSEAIIEAEHMEGMKGAAAIIDTAEQKTVYVINFTPKDGGAEVKNHLWVTEEELSSAE
ncbi:DUF1541 domain-containing protein [Bacillus infantis]|uniref:YdhK family protein n=1 Tax=Bacillus infantis TaxID=324767 RepID=UPI00101E056E|nr:YdhK family protein [Bacillus infantis]RYI28449.1 DUF1541 domain-containing protein [Bacillus infantis]